jgi:hypothetical protein
MEESNKRASGLPDDQSSMTSAAFEMRRGLKASLSPVSHMTSPPKAPSPKTTPQRNARPRRRRYLVGRIKQSNCYDPHEIARLLEIHPNTVRHWLKGGLQAIDGRRPTLVHGTVLRAFISERQKARRQKCGLGEFFCFRCRVPRSAWGDTADLATHTEKVARLTALCCVCETAMHRTIRREDISKIAALIDLQMMAPERLGESPDPIPICQLEKDQDGAETEPAK